MASPTSVRFFGLDIFRGIAALAVVVWHWQHLYFLPGSAAYDPASQPGFFILFPLYIDGWLAVEIFFCISGFVFFWLYSETLSERSMGARTFFTLRFSRLYPLYLLTLLIVGIGQSIYGHFNQGYFVYGFSLTDFVRNLFFLQNWSSRANQTINGPAWSVCVEILLYISFFFYCRYVPRISLAQLVALTLAGFPLSLVDVDLGRGVIGFFSGGVVYLVYLRLDRSPQRSRALILSASVATLGWIVAVAEVRFGVLSAMIVSAANSVPIGPVIVKLSKQALIVPIRLVVIPLSVLALVLSERMRPA